MDPELISERGQLYHGDCLVVLPQFGDASVDLVFADPPFNLKKDYGKGVSDSLVEADYLSWCQAWISECIRVLAPGGALYLWNLPRWNVELAHMLNMHGDMMFRHWITVDIKYGLPIQGKLYPSHYSLLYYTKGKPKTFARPRLPIQVCRHCGGDVKDYGGHRSKVHPDGLNLTDVWLDIAPVRHASTKWRGANGLSEKLLERVLTISSQPGDLVLDPFGGSGTTYAVAERMHRHWLGIELGDIAPTIRRLTGQTADAAAMPGLGDVGKGLSA
jgi:site-specific DNA-methyltransferase (adenine-specific)